MKYIHSYIPIAYSYILRVQKFVKYENQSPEELFCIQKFANDIIENHHMLSRFFTMARGLHSLKFLTAFEIFQVLS